MPDLQHFLARLYVEEPLRAAFIAAPYEVALCEGFSEAEARELAKMDAQDLELAARGFARKRGA